MDVRTGSRFSAALPRLRGGALRVAGCIAFLVALVLPLAWAVGDDRVPDWEVTEASQRAVHRGLEYLRRSQGADGAWTETIGRKVNNLYLGHYDRHVGVTALACIALMSNGSLPDRGPYGPEVRKGLDWVIEQVREEGFITANGSRMYSHAFATLFLAEVYGMTGRTDVKGALKRAVSCIVNAQNGQGGWRYLPSAKDSDMSITVCDVQALRAARNAGIHVPRESIDRAIRYVKRSYIANDPMRRVGFWYQIFDDQPFRPSRTSFALTAAGVTALYGAGEYDGPEVRGGVQALSDRTYWPDPEDMNRTFDYFYGHYYAVQALFQAGGQDWRDYFPAIRDDLVAGQRADGSWKDQVGPNYATAMACIILQVPYRLLPIFER